MSIGRGWAEEQEQDEIQVLAASELKKLVYRIVRIARVRKWQKRRMRALKHF